MRRRRGEVAREPWRRSATSAEMTRRCERRRDRFRVNLTKAAGLLGETRRRRPLNPCPPFFAAAPPLAPLARAAAAFVGDFVRPARRANSLAIQARVPKMPETSAGT